MTTRCRGRWAYNKNLLNRERSLSLSLCSYIFLVLYAIHRLLQLIVAACRLKLSWITAGCC